MGCGCSVIQERKRQAQKGRLRRLGNRGGQGRNFHKPRYRRGTRRPLKKTKESTGSVERTRGRRSRILEALQWKRDWESKKNSQKKNDMEEKEEIRKKVDQQWGPCPRRNAAQRTRSETLTRISNGIGRTCAKVKGLKNPSPRRKKKSKNSAGWPGYSPGGWEQKHQNKNRGR